MKRSSLTSGLLLIATVAFSQTGELVRKLDDAKGQAKIVIMSLAGLVFVFLIARAVLAFFKDDIRKSTMYVGWGVVCLVIAYMADDIQELVRSIFQ